MLRDWAAQVPETFTFAIKASHAHHAPRAAQAGVRQRARLPAAEHGGARRPARPDPLPAAAEHEEGRRSGCAAFSVCCRPDRRYTIEFRHESWFDDDVFDALREHDVALCVAEQEDFACPVHVDGVVGLPAAAPPGLRRRCLGEWATCIAAQAWTDAYVFFKHDEGVGSGPPAVEAFSLRTRARWQLPDAEFD